MISTKSAARVCAGRNNQLKRGQITPTGLQRLREAALMNQPWRYSTGPRTTAGKSHSAANGHGHCKDPSSRRQIRAGLAGVFALVQSMNVWRRRVVEELVLQGHADQTPA